MSSQPRPWPQLMMLRTRNSRKPSKPPGSDSNEPSGGLVRSAGCSGKKDGQSYMTNGGAA